MKFNYDKRRAHLSSLVISGQMTRDEALNSMKENVYAEEEIGNDMEYVAKKLDWSLKEFRAIIDLPPHRHQDFPTNERLFSFGLKLKNFLTAKNAKAGL